MGGLAAWDPRRIEPDRRWWESRALVWRQRLRVAAGKNRLGASVEHAGTAAVRNAAVRCMRGGLRQA